MLFLPRCDGEEIPLTLVRFFLPSGLANESSMRYIELSTKDRTYCFERSCSTSTPGTSIDDEVASCPKCSRTTCVTCKAPPHSGDCPEDTALQELMEMANNK